MNAYLPKGHEYDSLDQHELNAGAVLSEELLGRGGRSIEG
jgi:hypothetical protein